MNPIYIQLGISVLLELARRRAIMEIRKIGIEIKCYYKEKENE